MKPIDLLYFEDINPFHEAVFGFPIIGKLSMRQMLIMGISAIASWSIYQSSGNALSMLPLGIGFYVGLKKFNVLSMESQALAMIKFVLCENKRQTRIRNKFSIALENRKSSSLGPAQHFQPKLKGSDTPIRIREIVTDPLKPIRMQIKLESPEQKPLQNSRIRVLLEGQIISILTTNQNGELEALIIPKTTGEKRLSIFADNYSEPVFEEILLIKNQDA